MRPELTELLLAARSGEAEAQDRLFEAAYPALRQIARAQLNQHSTGSTLHTTALVHEAYLKLFDQSVVSSGDRVKFLGIAARAMRQILVDHFRRRSAQKRGGDVEHVDLDAVDIRDERSGEWLLALDEALLRLEEFSPRLAQVVESRFFGGLTEVEIAEQMKVSDRTVRNDWRKAKAWLALALNDGGNP